jgi:hypothetical protein
MMNRLRTVLVSVTAVAVTMMVLGSNAQAKSVVPTASQQKYLRFLQKLTQKETKLTQEEMKLAQRDMNLAQRDMNLGNSLMQKYSSLESAMNSLILNSHPSPRLNREIATLYNQELRVFSNIQQNINALRASEAVLQKQYQALGSQETADLSVGLVSLARSVAIEQSQVLNVETGVQGLVVAERGAPRPEKGVATPVR